MGEIWDALTEAEKKRSGERILREKVQPPKGLSAETAAAVAAGELVIDADDPQSELLKGILEPPDQPDQ